MNHQKIALTALALLFAACGGSGSRVAPVAAPAGDHGARPAVAPEPAAPPAPDEAFGESEAAAPAAPLAGQAPPRAQAERSRPADQRDMDASLRPGLATLWGEDRRSHIEFTRFLRATPETPFSAARVFYNDEDGVRAMAARSGISDFSDSGRGGNGLITVRLLDEDGDPLPGFEVASRHYVVGEPGERYMLRIENRSGVRFEAVATVDGLDVIDGRMGSFNKRGYIVDAFGTTDIDGFRRSTDTVAAFRFGSVGESYAARKGDARNVGVIGVAFFHEQGSDPRLDDAEIRRRHDANPFPGRFAAPPSSG
ncbi:MAG TPA: hypothetical protein VF989_16900 [Polyangiaceae bacterium]